MDNPNSSIQSRDASDVNDHGKFDLSASLRAFFARKITTQDSPPACDSLPPAPLRPRSKTETTESGISSESPLTSPLEPTESAQLNLEI
jgi:hypothetical protein